MNFPEDNKVISPFCVSSLDDQTLGEIIAKKICSKIEASSIETMKQGGLTSTQIATVHERLERMATQAELQFGKTCSLSDSNFQEYIETQLTALIASVVETVAGQAPDLIREASLSEAVFSHKGDYRPILATDSLATCIGVAGYDPVNTFGFVIHFTCEDEVKASGAMLLDRIRTYREQNSTSPLLIHLRGGIKGMSESLLEKVKAWLLSSDVNIIIASEETLQTPISPNIGIPKVPGTIKLDVRTGTCEKYDATINPYSTKKSHDISTLNPDLFMKLLIQTSTKKPEIRIVYDSKNSFI